MLIRPILLLPVVHGFLLENNHSVVGQTTLSSQYLKLSVFLDEKNRLQQATERISQNTVQLRHDMDTNLAVLSSQLLQKFNVLEQKLGEVKQLNETQKELALIQHKHVTLEQKYSRLQNSYEQLKRENDLLHVEFQLIKNARGQDFLALYNMTVASKRSVIKIDSQIGRRIDDLERKINDTLEQNEQVAILAYPPFIRNTGINGVVTFSDVEFSVGINNISAYKTSGIFICESSGVYLVSVSTLSPLADRNIRVVLNGNHISYTRVSDGQWQTGTTAVAVQLLNKDKLWIEADSMLVAPRPYTFFSIVKVQ
ncbi:unnamed protein product [Mytilus coruscus]|uniref:C1q domain-containing protein n=1 Tax=Mytilus coruscus TaxID=42192 RepID=A0A6J8DYJ9_MYTCO|nr:unnamed protein product [Mytilus coruscus]